MAGMRALTTCRAAVLLCAAVASQIGAAGAFASPVRLGRTPSARASLQLGSSALPRGAHTRSPACPSSGPHMMLQLRGGQGVVSSLRSGALSVGTLYNSVFWVLALACLALQVVVRSRQQSGGEAAALTAPERSLRNRFLAVFWLYKMADWLQGPYFYDVYASKLIGGIPVSADGVARLFLAGFGSTMLIGPFVGSMVDLLGRKRASLAFAAAYSLGALSTSAASLPLLYAGRFCGGVGTSLLFSAPEAWLIGEHSKGGMGGSLLSQTFGLAYLGDSVVAMLAGQLAGGVASYGGPVAPFLLSIGFLLLGATLVATTWKENFGGGGGSGGGGSGEGAKGEAGGEGSNALVRRVGSAWQAMLSDKRVMLVGGIQAFFEGAMYTFVLVWPPAFRAAIGALGDAASGAAVPFGAIFSCFMACCMLGSSAFALAAKAGRRTESVTVSMLALGVGAMATATVAASRSALGALTLALFAFEACVGVYFPCIGTLRSKVLPDEHRGAIMNLFGIPLNLIVVVVFLSIGKLGTVGALRCSTAALSCALLAAIGLSRANAQPQKGDAQPAPAA